MSPCIVLWCPHLRLPRKLEFNHIDCSLIIIIIASFYVTPHTDEVRHIASHSITSGHRYPPPLHMCGSSSWEWDSSRLYSSICIVLSMNLPGQQGNQRLIVEVTFLKRRECGTNDVTQERHSHPVADVLSPPTMMKEQQASVYSFLPRDITSTINRKPSATLK